MEHIDYDKQHWINRLFLRLAMFVGEGILEEAEEIRIIDIEENYRDTGQMSVSDLNWLRRTLTGLEQDEEVIWEEEL